MIGVLESSHLGRGGGGGGVHSVPSVANGFLVEGDLKTLFTGGMS